YTYLKYGEAFLDLDFQVDCLPLHAPDNFHPGSKVQNGSESVQQSVNVESVHAHPRNKVYRQSRLNSINMKLAYAHLYGAPTILKIQLLHLGVILHREFQHPLSIPMTCFVIPMLNFQQNNLLYLGLSAHHIDVMLSHQSG